MIQPGIITIGLEVYIKVDNRAIKIEVGNGYEAMQVLFMCYYVFNVKYSPDLSIFYYFLENLWGMPSEKKSTRVGDLIANLVQK